MGSHRSAGLLNEHSRTANFMLNGNTSLNHWHTEALDVHVVFSWDSLDRDCVVKSLIRCTCMTGSCNTFAHVYFGIQTHIERERERESIVLSLLHLHFQSFVPVMLLYATSVHFFFRCFIYLLVLCVFCICMNAFLHS